MQFLSMPLKCRFKIKISFMYLLKYSHNTTFLTNDYPVSSFSVYSVCKHVCCRMRACLCIYCHECTMSCQGVPVVSAALQVLMRLIHSLSVFNLDSTDHQWVTVSTKHSKLTVFFLQNFECNSNIYLLEASAHNS